MNAPPPATALRQERLLLLPFLLGFAAIPETDLMGRLMGVDLLFLAGAFLAIAQRDSHRIPREVGVLIALALLWLLGALITDLYRGSELIDSARGQSRIVITIAGLLFLGNRASQNIDWVPSFWIGLMVALGIKPLFVEQWGFDVAPWKFGYFSAGLAGAIFLIERFKIGGRARFLFGSAIVIGLAFVSLFNDYRSAFALLALAGLFIAFRKAIYRTVFTGGANPFVIVFMFVAALGVTQAISWSYENLASSGALGTRAEQRYSLQSQLDLPLILAGRQEILVSSQAIADSPVIGHGSWARDPQYEKQLAYMLVRAGMAPARAVRDTEVIPTHSYIAGAWVDHGVLAVPFWIGVLLLLLAGLKASVLPELRHRELICCMAFLTIWNVLFSPFGLDSRITLAAVCVIIASERRAVAARALGLRGPAQTDRRINPGLGARE